MTTADKVEDDERSGALTGTLTRLLPWLRRMGVRHQLSGDDFAQDACLHLLRVASPDMIQQPDRYVSRVARNLVIDRQRARSREARVIVADADLHQTVPDFAADPEQIVAGKQRLARVLAAIEELPPRRREAFRLHRFEGLTYAAIARRMGMSTSGVEKHIAHAMERLDRVLAEGDGDAI